MQQFGQEPGARGRASGDIISPPAPLLFQKEFKLLQGHVGRATHSWAHKPTGQGKETRPPLLCPAPCTKAPPRKHRPRAAAALREDAVGLRDADLTQLAAGEAAAPHSVLEGIK